MGRSRRARSSRPRYTLARACPASLRVNTSPARASTSASITSDLFLPVIAPRSRAACRDPSNANLPPASSTAAASASQLIEVGSATATAPGYSASRSVSRANPASVGGTMNRRIRTAPSASSSRTHTWWFAITAASMPTCTRARTPVDPDGGVHSALASTSTRVLPSLARRRAPGP
jgi:hypothetical protein